MIRRLAYVSRPRPDLPLMEIPRIVAASRANNQGNGLFGVLVYTGTEFAQLIEGDPARVEELWQRLRTDTRHLDMTVLLDEQDSLPWSSDWRMGYVHDLEQARKLSEWRVRARSVPREELAALRLMFTTADAF